MMEKFGVLSNTYEVVVPIPGKPDDYQVIGSNLSLADANNVRNLNPQAIVRPE